MDQIVPTGDQISLLNAYERFRTDPSQHIMVGAGWAGTGKTTIGVGSIAGDAVLRGDAVCMTAPTHKALNVLMAKSARSRLENRVEFATIHSLLGMQMEPDDNGNLVLKSSERARVSQFDTIINDESSMLSSSMFAQIVRHKSQWVKWLLLGDPGQLPPVNEENSPVFVSGLPTVFMTQIVRQAADNPILKLATAARLVIEGVASTISTDVIRPFVAEQHDWDDKLWKDEEAVAIAWRNARVEELNRTIRHRRLHGKITGILPQWIVGEKVVLTSPLMMNGELMLAPSEEATIGFLSETEFNGIPAWIVRLNSPIGDVTTKTFRANGKMLFMKRMREKAEYIRGRQDRTERKLLWADYWDEMNGWAFLDYAYAFTVHRAQGSEWPNVFVDFGDCMRNQKVSERRRLIYTAFTRAKNNLSLLYK